MFLVKIFAFAPAWLPACLPVCPSLFTLSSPRMSLRFSFSELENYESPTLCNNFVGLSAYQNVYESTGFIRVCELRTACSIDTTGWRTTLRHTHVVWQRSHS